MVSLAKMTEKENNTKSIKLLTAQRELKGLEARHLLMIMVIPLSKSITQHIRLLDSP